MRHATSRELYAYWNRVRGEEPAPLRSDIEPGGLRRILPDTFILEVAGSGRLLVRLAGTRICSLYGREIKGLPFLDLWARDDRDAVTKAARRICEEAAGAVIEADLVSARGRVVRCEFLLLPLRQGMAARDRILGSCAAHRRPYWFGSDPVLRQSIAEMRLLAPGGRGPDGRSRLVSLPPAFFRSRTGRRHGHLYVLDGGKR